MKITSRIKKIFKNAKKDTEWCKEAEQRQKRISKT